MKNNIALPLLLSITLFVFGYVAYAQIATGQLSACVRQNGNVRFIVPGFSTTTCTSNEQEVTWNIIGPVGPQGVAGINLRLKDEAGNDFGSFIGVEANVIIKAFNESNNAILEFSSSYFPGGSGLILPSKDYEYYSSGDCSGELYAVPNTYFSQGLLSFYSSGNDTYVADISSRMPRIFSSYRLPSGICEPLNQQEMLSYRVSKVVLPEIVGTLRVVRE